MNDIWGATETCPHCGMQNFYPEWDAEKQGYIAKCQECGQEIFLCDECLHADDNPGQYCDWHSNCKCHRGKTKMKGTNIYFVNPDGNNEDETQFDTVNKKELAELWFEFCIDEGIITGYEEVEVNE